MNRVLLTCVLGISLFLTACGAPTTPTQAQIQHDARCAAGILGGAALGGVVGNRIGDGTGKTLATAAGAGLGMYAGQSVCN
ncbi:glycine zipper 2TM domain-containing protein [Ruegeria atlantica]|uniref:17 kDa surface antigen n=1 Tax=Ruegeria atlantica TaxID=81569 RepID=A0A0P1E4A8_9RHOB|nr:glycine zipper 2TM domain-containing protein [Ruegeria atlantica]CUH41991.1 Glycine zipper 2TM domain protein [Ruegeria atlantica]